MQKLWQWFCQMAITNPDILTGIDKEQSNSFR
jgi:hypothetical protein